MVDVYPGPWTMSVALNRKRSRLALEEDEDEVERPPPPPQQQQRIPEPSPALSTFSDSLKRTRTQSDLEDLDIIPAEEAWSVDVDGILSSHTLATSPWSGLQAHSNVDKFQKNASILVLCVQGNLHLHYDLLCATLPDLYALSPSLQALVLCRDPATHVPSTSAPFSLPLVQAVGPSYNHFVRLGLLHPLGGGNFPLDALVVVDARGRRRLLLPFGWGAGKHAGTPAGRIVQTRLMELLRQCIQTLMEE